MEVFLCENSTIFQVTYENGSLNKGMSLWGIQISISQCFLAIFRSRNSCWSARPEMLAICVSSKATPDSRRLLWKLASCSPTSAAANTVLNALRGLWSLPGDGGGVASE